MNRSFEPPPSFRLPRTIEILLALVIVLELFAPFVAKTYGTDGPPHLYWIERFWELFSSGIFTPRWIPQSFHGYGAPTFYFYPPLFFYLTTFVRFLTGISNAYRLMMITGLVLSVASFFTSWQLLRTIGAGSYQAALGACLYAFAPFRIAEVYSRTSLSSHLGYVFIPLIACGLFEIMTSRNKRRGILLFGISSTLLILSSIPLTFATTVAIVVVAIIEHKKINAPVARKLIISTVVMLALSAFYTIPAAEYHSSVQLNQLVRSPVYLIVNLFKETTLPAVYHFALLYIAAGTLAFAYRSFRNNPATLTKQETTALRIGLSIIGVVAFLDMPIVSEPIWNRISAIAQGTWRFYIFFVLFVSVNAGIARSTLMKRSISVIAGIWSIGSLIPMILILGDVHLFSHTTDEPGDRPEYLPRAANVLIFTSRPLNIDSSGSEHSTDDFISDRSQPEKITFHQFYWPAWHLYVDDSEISTWPDNLGRAVAKLPNGNYRVHWKLERSRTEKTVIWISEFSIVIVLLISGMPLLLNCVKRKNRTLSQILHKK
jgi:hypothetical protein